VTTLVLAMIALVAAAVLIGVTWSLVRAMRMESSSAALQSSATSWPRGATVEVAHDPADPTRFALACPAERGRVVATAPEFRHDKGIQPAPAATQPVPVP
jgi:hypothetical protein